MKAFNGKAIYQPSGKAAEYTTGMANLTKQLAEKDKEIQALNEVLVGSVDRLKAKDREIERLKFMIEHGLDCEDMQNDIAMPHEI